MEAIANQEVTGTSHLECEEWFFGVSDELLVHIERRPVTDEYLGGVVTLLEDFQGKAIGHSYTCYWAGSTCVHVLTDSHGKVWKVYAVDLVRSS